MILCSGGNAGNLGRPGDFCFTTGAETMIREQGGSRLVSALAGVAALAVAAVAPTSLHSEGRGGGAGIWEAIRSHVPASARRSAVDHPTLTFFRVDQPPRVVAKREPVPAPAPASAQERYVCVRLCDGAQLALGFTATGPSVGEYASMCRAAGAGNEVTLMMAPLGRPDVSEARLSGASAPTRSYASMAKFLDSRHETAGRCAGAAPMSVPIEADTTLRAGDIVATASGFKVYVDGGKKGHLVDAEKGTRVPRHVRQAVRRLASGG
jgi:hypothetical protein